MRRIRRTNRFKKDFRRMIRRGGSQEKFLKIVTALQKDDPLPPTARPHMLSGTWAGFWECHIAPDWLLIYELTEDEVILVRTGTHADLFE